MAKPASPTMTFQNRNPVAAGDAALCPTEARRRAANPVGTPVFIRSVLALANAEGSRSDSGSVLLV